jgi:predicted kinase
MFAQPSHSEEESLELYERLNGVVKKMLADGKSVVFDTNFNHYHDREILRELAVKQGSDTKLVWLTTPAAVARDRAVHANIVRNGYKFVMTGEEFDTIARKFEPPREDEKVIKIDGVKLDDSELLRLI